MKITMLIRLLKNALKSVALAMFFVFLLKHVSINDSTQGPLSTIKYWKKNAVLVDGRYAGTRLPYFVIPLVEESLYKGKVMEKFPSSERSFPANLRHPAPVKDYIVRAPPPYAIKQVGSDVPTDAPGPRRLTHIKDYFEYLQRPRHRCRKLKRMGGTYLCNGEGDERGMDGHKYICMDPSLELGGSRDPKDCLTLSYGVHTDSTFDADVAELPCEVHMFDVLDFAPYLPQEVPHVFFHVEGLARRQSTTYYKNLNYSATMDDLVGHMLKYKLAPRPINILQIDIEGAEWEALADLNTEGLPILQAVGQIAIELHVVDLAQGLGYDWLDTKPPDQWLEVLQKRFDVLMALENMGFRPVVYWDNVQNKFALYDKDGTRYETAGELLYVNTNWYNATFKKELTESGVPFRGFK
ncbi:uncharacterized protein LOC122247692 [Penaeus japonicus]|uniref:uncharacterized protein LOC122247692 n=1 Tax=Penaeus japonicus TaxID=27405 RepID=UPI001C70D2E7|nr:uncharacterized protein LOC122247692 [Penaeus japonicus]